MKPEIEIAIRTIALADGVPAERVEAGIAAMKMGAGYETQEPLYSLKKITPLVGYNHCSFLHKLQIQRVGISYGGRLSYRLSDVVNYLRSPECAAIRAELKKKRRETTKAKASNL
ncbi:MAG: hypothetical protein KJ964_02225 [Verrucomicrobia bacterium]|nr:hypothetical protein [Verrucomicrobiota bacterium]MBU1857170.1 hypothetical protein [Verrucomicrobiota bacterium]